jgi:MFS family permease
MNPLLAAEFDLSQTQLNLITGSCVLALGYANFIIVPMSNIFGRRPTSIALAAFAAGSCIWEARAQSYGSLIGARVVNGFATATSESMAVQVICDLFFLHERGFWMGVYL